MDKPTAIWRSQPVRLGTRLASVGVCLALMPAVPANASIRNTRLLAYPSSQAKAFRVRPDVMTPSGTGGLFWGGRRYRGHRFGRIDWKSWGKANAYGRGVWWQNNCNPDCVSGTYYDAGSIRLHAFSPVHHRFTRLTLTGRVNGRGFNQTFRLAFNRGWQWG